MSKRIARVIALILTVTWLDSVAQAPAQTVPDGNEIPLFDVIPAPTLMLPGAADSNSPAYWQYVQGQNRLHIVTSWWTPSISRGFSVNRMGRPQPAKFVNS